jgi:hypothetical protein
MERDNLFYCYSGKLKKFISDKGIKFLHKGLNDKTNKWFFVYVRNEEFYKALTEWSQNK